MVCLIVEEGFAPAEKERTSNPIYYELVAYLIKRAVFIVMWEREIGDKMKKKHYALDVISVAIIIFNIISVISFMLPPGRAFYLPSRCENKYV